MVPSWPEAAQLLGGAQPGERGPDDDDVVEAHRRVRRCSAQPSIVMACLGQRRAASSTLLAQLLARLVLEHVEEVVVAHLEHLGRGGHAQGVALAEVVVDDDAHDGSPPGSRSDGGFSDAEPTLPGSCP